MKFLSEVEKLSIKNNIENQGLCWFCNSFMIDLLIINGEYYNKNFLGIESERKWKDESISFFFISDKERLVADNDSFVWIKQASIFNDLYALMGKKLDYNEFEKTEHQQFNTLEALFFHIESWMDEYGEAMMKLIKITEENNAVEEIEK